MTINRVFGCKPAAQAFRLSPLNIEYPAMDQNCLVTSVLVTVVILIFQNKESIKNKTFPLLLLKSQETGWLMGSSVMYRAFNLLFTSGRSKRKMSPLGSCLLSHLSPSHSGGLLLSRSTACPHAPGQVCSPRRGLRSCVRKERGFTLASQVWLPRLRWRHAVMKRKSEL